MGNPTGSCHSVGTMFLVRDLVSPRTWLAMTSHLAGLVIGFAVIFVFTFGLGFGFSLVVIALVGLPVLGVTLRFAELVRHGRAGQARPDARGADPGLARRGPGRVPVGHRAALADVHRAGDLERNRLRAAAAAGQRGCRDGQRRGLGRGPGHADAAAVQLVAAQRRRQDRRLRAARHAQDDGLGGDRPASAAGCGAADPRVRGRGRGDVPPAARPAPRPGRPGDRAGDQPGTGGGRGRGGAAADRA